MVTRPRLRPQDRGLINLVVEHSLPAIFGCRVVSFSRVEGEMEKPTERGAANAGEVDRGQMIFHGVLKSVFPHLHHFVLEIGLSCLGSQVGSASWENDSDFSQNVGKICTEFFRILLVSLLRHAEDSDNEPGPRWSSHQTFFRTDVCHNKYLNKLPLFVSNALVPPALVLSIQHRLPSPNYLLP